MKHFRYLLLAAAVCCAFACQRVEDPVGPVDPVDPDPPVQPRELTDAQKAEELNQTLVSLKTAWEAMMDCDCATLSTAITENDCLIGYQVHFRRHGYVKFFLDENIDGMKYGQVGIKEDKDGNWYWTCGDGYFAVTGGSRVRVADDLLIGRCQYNNWYFCYKENMLWTSVGKTTGDDAIAGMHCVKSISHDKETMTIELSNGQKMEFFWQNSECDVCFGGEKPVCLPGKGIKLRYTVKSVSDWQMEYTTNSPWKVERIETDANAGYFAIHAPANPQGVELSVTLTNAGGSVCRRIPLSVGYLKPARKTINVEAAGGENALAIDSDADYEMVVDQHSASWLSLKDNVVKAAKNTVKDGRTGYVVLLDPLGDEIDRIEIVQAGVIAYYYETSVAECLAAQPDEIDFYILKGTVSDIQEGGRLILSDDSGSIPVDGLANYDEYADRIFLPDLIVTLMGHRAEAGGKPVLEGASIVGVKDPHAKAPHSWMELPAVYDDDGLDFFSHSMTIGDLHTRNYSFYWDYDNLVAHWVAYPLNRGLRSSGYRTDAWDNNLDPLLPRSKQPVLFRGFNPGNTGRSYDRGHQCPSADRYEYNANVETFYGTNMTPQMGALNQNFWALLEDKVRSWSNVCDTLYVVTGCTLENSPGYALDNDGKHVTVPGGYFKALLAYKKDASFGHDGYLSLAIFLEHRNYTETRIDPTMTMSVDELEAITGIDFFANLPAAIGVETADLVEAEQPSETSWWW